MTEMCLIGVIERETNNVKTTTKFWLDVDVYNSTFRITRNPLGGETTRVF